MKFSISLVLIVGLASGTVLSLPVQDSPKVKLELFYAAWCPPCHKLVTGNLSSIMDRLGKYIDFHANPRFRNDSERDVLFNHVEKLELCASDQLGQNKGFEYLKCNMMKMIQEVKKAEKRAKECAKQLEINFDKLETCAKGDRGTQLAEASKQRFEDEHVYLVPELFLDGIKIPWEVYQEDLIKYLCKNEKLQKVPECN